MTDTVPDFLSHLRLDDRGTPVPYVARWGPERLDAVAIKVDRAVGTAVFLPDEDQTVPDLQHMSYQRQRECVTEGLCQICKRRVPWSRRFLALSDQRIEETMVRGRRNATTIEPWLDQRCAEYAIEHHPELIRAQPDEDIRLVAITTKRDVMYGFSRGYADGVLEGVDEALQPVLWMEILLPAYALTEKISASAS